MMTTMKQQSSKGLRFAIYTRYSSEMQNELSLAAQEDHCRRAITHRKGKAIAVFSDGARSGWSLEREGFIALCRAAEAGKFDAVMFWKFDRLARHHDQAVMIKMLLRHEYGLKLFCVEGFSEDEDNSPYTAMMEQMLAIFAAFYSQNLSSETKRGKYQRAARGEFNGSVPPLGYELVRISEATAEHPAGLYIIPRIAALIRRAFRRYASGKYCDLDISRWLNQRKEIQKLREGMPPIGGDSVRDLLQNRVYTGRVPYAETIYSGSLGERKQSNRHHKQWFEGKHQGFIPDDLFDRCQQVRRSFLKGQRAPATLRTYPLQGRVFCRPCLRSKPGMLVDKNYGKMSAVWIKRSNKAVYRCRAKQRGYASCGQRSIPTQSVDNQVVQALCAIVLPAGWERRIDVAIRSKDEHVETLRRIEELEETIRRIDFSWEQGFLVEEVYLLKRTQLQDEIQSLRPLDYDELEAVADLLGNFNEYWQICAAADDQAKEQQSLLGKIVDKVFVCDQYVDSIVLKEPFSILLNNAHYLQRRGDNYFLTYSLESVNKVEVTK